MKLICFIIDRQHVQGEMTATPVTGVNNSFFPQQRTIDPLIKSDSELTQLETSQSQILLS